MGRTLTVGYAFNASKEAFLATRLRVADTSWSRLIGLLGTKAEQFLPGMGLWIVPCHGVHTFAMTFPIDVVYLTEEKIVHHCEESVRPWRTTAIRTEAMTVLELPARTIWQTGTTVGDRIEVEFPEGWDGK